MRGRWLKLLQGWTKRTLPNRLEEKQTNPRRLAWWLLRVWFIEPGPRVVVGMGERRELSLHTMFLKAKEPRQASPGNISPRKPSGWCIPSALHMTPACPPCSAAFLWVSLRGLPSELLHFFYGPFSSKEGKWGLFHKGHTWKVFQHDLGFKLMS